MMKPIRILVIAGPTAVGKTAFAIEAAKQFAGEIVSCDSMQIYRYMDIGSAKPTKEELAAVRHHLVDVIDPRDEFSVAGYQRMAMQAIRDIDSRGMLPIVCGGTGLYLNSLLYEMDFGEGPKDPALRAELEETARREGSAALHDMLLRKDPKAAGRIHPNNTKKLIRALEEAAPEAKLHYRFTLYDIPLTLEDEEIDLSYRYIAEGWPEVLEIAECMPNLKTLLMDTCAVGNEDMAKIRDALPDTEVVWRINFGGAYTARTNETRILASSPSVGGALGDRDVEVFKYFTKMKYLDIGHNELITDLSFARYMPDLEVLIVAMNPLGDLSPLADCPKLEYLELFYSMTDDLSPLAGLKNLKHLNVGHCPKLTDISPIYDLELERFYLGTFASCPVPPEQVDRYRELHPDCEVDNESWESSEGAWRRAAFLEGEELEWYKKQPYYSEERQNYAPRYALLRDQMGYDGLLYSTKWNDPTWQYVGW